MWGRYEPNGLYTENCIVMAKSLKWELADINCSPRAHYLCKRAVHGTRSSFPTVEQARMKDICWVELQTFIDHPFLIILAHAGFFIVNKGIEVNSWTSYFRLFRTVKFKWQRHHICLNVNVYRSNHSLPFVMTLQEQGYALFLLGSILHRNKDRWSLICFNVLLIPADIGMKNLYCVVKLIKVYLALKQNKICFQTNYCSQCILFLCIIHCVRCCKNTSLHLFPSSYHLKGHALFHLYSK